VCLLQSIFHGEELQLYITYLNTIQKSYSELLMSSRKRQSDLETLMDFVQSATNELMWLKEKEEREITRDWSSKNLSLVEVEQYYEVRTKYFIFLLFRFCDVICVNG
jgi:dystonin